MKPITTIEEFEKRYFPNDVEKYPVSMHIRVTEEESRAIQEWIRNRHCNNYLEGDRLGCDGIILFMDDNPNVDAETMKQILG